MRKIQLLLLLAFLACFVGAKADELTVADGTESSSYLPIYGSYLDTPGAYGQMIYPKAALEEMGGKSITSVKFYPTATFASKLAGAVIQISVMETDLDEMVYENYRYQPFANDAFTTCGTYTVVGGEEYLVFTLDNAFNYSGDKNLVIQTKVVTASNWNSMDFKGDNQSGYVSYYYGSSGNSDKFLPMATFEYEGEAKEYEAKVTPTALAFGSIEEKTDSCLTVTLKNKGINAFTPSLSGLEAPFSTTWTPAELTAGESVEIPVKFAPETPGEYSATLTLNCGEAGSFDVTLNGTAYQHVDEVTVADGTSTNTYVPITGNYIDTEGTYSQMIYAKESLTELAGTEITGVKFYAKEAFGTDVENAVLEISLCETDLNEMAKVNSYTYGPIATDNFTVCGTYTMVSTDDVMNFVFEEPFEYSGDKNLAVMVKVTAKSGYKAIPFYGVTKTDYVSYYYASTYQSGGNQFMPKTTFGYNKEVKEYNAKVSPQELAFGKLDAGAESTLNVTVENKGAKAFTPALSGLEAPFSTTWTAAEIAAGESVEIPVKFAPAEAGTFTATLTVDCGEAGKTEVALSGRAIEPGSEIIVCEGTETNAYIPVYGMYYDTQNTQSQFIYPASKLTALQGREITGIKFFHNGNLPLKGGQLQLSVKETEQTVFERETAIAKPNEITEMTVVGTVAMDNTTDEVEIIFSTPIAYNGGNLAFETLVTATGNYATTAFLGETQTEDCAFNTSSQGSNLYKFLPMIEFNSQAAAPVGEETDLAALLASGETDKAYTINEPLALVEVAANAPVAYLSNGTDWIRVDLNVARLTAEENIALLNAIDKSKAIKANALTGVLSNRETAATLTVTAVPAELVGDDAAPTCEVQNLDFVKDLRESMPKPGQVLNVSGYYNDGAITAFSGLNGTVGQAITLKTDFIDPINFVTASRYTLKLAIELKEAWDNGTSGAPKRASATSKTAYKNLSAQVLSGGPDVTTGVTDINAKGNAVSVKYVSTAGVVSNRPFDGINIVVTTNADGSISVTKMVK